MDKTRLAQAELLAGLSPDEADFLAQIARVVEYAPGEILFHEGDDSDTFSVVLEGQVEVFKSAQSGPERRLAVLEGQEFLGEMSLFFQTRKRSAGARSLGRAVVLEIPNAGFEALLKRRPDLVFTILQVTVQRMRSTEDATIQDLRAKNAELEQAYRDLKLAQEKLLARERLETELALARKIQEGLLPRQLPELEHWRMAALWKPALEVSGDFYDFLPLPGGALGLVIGDVTGKGMPAALVMATTRSVIRSVAYGQPGLRSPGELLAQINDLLCPDMPPNMFVTCLMAVLDPAGGGLVFANAGHNPPYLRCAAGVRELRARGMPLGLLPGMAYEVQEAALAPGDSLLAYSDGLVEAHNPQGQMFGGPRLEGLLDSPLQGEDLFGLLLGELARFTGEAWLQEDDVTLVALRRLL